MQLLLHRLSSGPRDTIGILYAVEKGKREALCWTLEDEARVVKLPGETRIPAGCYPVRLRLVGTHHAQYAQRFAWHVGMLEICSVPGFTNILIHIGNDEDDTAGCVLIGEMASLAGARRRLRNSTDAYEHVYRRSVDAAAKSALEIVIEDKG